MPSKNASLSARQQQKEDRLKLVRLKRLARDAFAAIDRGEHVTVAVEDIDAFLGKLKVT